MKEIVNELFNQIKPDKYLINFYYSVLSPSYYSNLLYYVSIKGDLKINGIKCSIAGSTGKHSQQKKETIIEEDEGPKLPTRDSVKRRKN